MLIRLKDRFRRGFSSVEIIALIAAMGVMIAIAGRMGGELSRVSAAASLSHTLSMTAASARNYLESRKEDLAAHLQGRDHIYATRNGLFDANGILLDPEGGFGAWLPARTGKTRFGQEARLYLYNGPDGVPRAILATWGGLPARKGQNASSRKRYMAVARKVVGMNGFGISASRTPAGARMEPAFVGDSGMWRFPFDDPEYGMIPASEFPDGQLARPIQIFTPKPSGNVLYRVDAGELNTMRTGIDMDGNDIRHAGTIEAGGVVLSPLDAGKSAREISGSICQNHPEGFTFTMSDADGELGGLWFCMNGKARLVSDFVNSRTLRASLTAKSGDVIGKPSCPPVTHGRVAIHPPSFMAEDRGDEWLIVKTGSGPETQAHISIYCEKAD